MKQIVHQFQYGRHQVTLETGIVARQATSAVMVHVDETIVLVSVVAAKEPKPAQTFFPLSVHYQERSYAAGKIPGSFFRREGRPGEGEILTSRLIDRAVRPLFPKSFLNEVQIILSVLSLDPEVNPDIVAMLGVSAALSISGLPFSGPISAARIGYTGSEFVLNPSPQEQLNCEMDLVMACKAEAILMVEASAQELDESIFLDGLAYGQGAQKIVLAEIQRFVDAVPHQAHPACRSFHASDALGVELKKAFEASVQLAYQLAPGAERQETLEALSHQAVAHLLEMPNAGEYTSTEAYTAFAGLERQVVRHRMLSEGIRVDGRSPEMVRALDVRTGVLPRTHGSALFTRGETQALVTVTLGTEREAKIVDDLCGERTDPLMVHYNFLPFCVGEIGMMASPKRREIGHGKLVKRGISGVLPRKEQFPYSIRIVAEVTESNGSSSMASLCGASLALMDAGVPTRAAVAGVAMGLIKEGDQYVVLSDINATEDKLGDMDFKVAGTAVGITALQMDIKVLGLSKEILLEALLQAKRARLHILRVMNSALSEPVEELAEFAPRIHTMQIPPEKIKDVIGKGGSVIRRLSEESGAKIDLTDTGMVTIATTHRSTAQQVMDRISAITMDLEEGRLYEGRVTRIVEFGAFVLVGGAKEGLVHISQIAKDRVERVSDCLEVGQAVTVKVLAADRQGRLKLSIKEAFTIQDLDQCSTVASLEDEFSEAPLMCAQPSESHGR